MVTYNDIATLTTEEIKGIYFKNDISRLNVYMPNGIIATIYLVIENKSLVIKLVEVMDYNMNVVLNDARVINCSFDTISGVDSFIIKLIKPFIVTYDDTGLILNVQERESNTGEYFTKEIFKVYNNKYIPESFKQKRKFLIRYYDVIKNELVLWSPVDELKTMYLFKVHFSSNRGVEVEYASER